MSLNQDAVKVAAEASGIINDVKTQSNSVYSDIIGSVNNLQQFWHTTTVGINIDQIPIMKNAISLYVDRLNNHLNQVKRDADTSQAFKGDYARAVRSFVDAVCNSCANIISNLLAFNDDLDKVMEAYRQKDESMASEINSTAGNVDSAFTNYNSR